MSGTAGTVQSGLEQLLGERRSLLAGRRIGLLCNPTAVLPDLSHVADVVAAAEDLDLRLLFGPEHGIRADAQDMIPVEGSVDRETGLPVVSLYGHDEKSLEPTPDQLSQIDVLVYDIQDIGSRYYTYVYTLAFCLRPCLEAGVPIIVCDRPNPITGAAVEGNLVDTGKFRSFVGRFALPNRHGMTAGELAHWFADAQGLTLPDGFLTVLPCRGWRRDQWFDETGLPWVMPSPNMPTLDTAIVYPGQCLVEGTLLSEGRGTTRPFELFGAPYVEPARLRAALAAELERYGLGGVGLRACAFRPTFQKLAGEVCGGVQLHVTDRRSFRPLATSVAALTVLHRLYPEAFAWRTERYEFVTDRLAIDLLSGDRTIREAVESGEGLAALLPLWERSERAFLEQSAPFRLY